jgi:UDP:flavonoid glycosyltransferase YjiC (YdhE family)
MLCFAHAGQAAGHEVAIATLGDFGRDVEGAGIKFFAVGGDAIALALQKDPGFLTRRNDPAQRNAIRREMLAELRVELALPHLVEVCQRWRPDVLVRGHIELSGYLVAEELGIPHVVVEEHASGNLATLPEVIGPPLALWREKRGLPSDPSLGGLDGDLCLVPFPKALRDARAPFGRQARRMQPLILRREDEKLPSWVAQLRGPLVHVSLSTGSAEEAALLGRIVEALADQPMSVLMSCGPKSDPASFQPLPPNVRVVEYMSHSHLLPLCEAIITHGGAGTLVTAAASGVPMVLMPGYGDQPDNARCAAAAGVAIVLPRADATPGAIRDATLEVLKTKSYRERLELMRQEIDGLPAVDDAVGWLEEIGRNGTLVARDG